MRRRKLLQAFCLALLAAAVLMTQASLVHAAAEECRARPDLSGQMGNGHWHYRIDRISQRRCWFLSSGDSRVQHISSLRRRELINRSTEPEIEEQSKLDGRMSHRTHTNPGPHRRFRPTDVRGICGVRASMLSLRKVWFHAK